MSGNIVWADITVTLTSIRETILLRETLPVKYKAHYAMHTEMNNDINTQADNIAIMIKRYANQQSVVTGDDIPF